MFLTEKQIDELIQAEQAEAAKYAVQPHLFTFLYLELDLLVDKEKYLVFYHDGDWNCTCAFFEEWRTCRHIMGTALLLKDSLPQEARGDTW